MRYERGEKLTEEERKGGGQGADRTKKANEGGGNPNVPEGAFGGAKDTGVTGLEYLFPGLSEGLFGGPSFSDFNVGRYGGGKGAMAPGAEGDGDQRRKLELLADLWRQGLEAKQATQIRPAEAYEAQARAADPAGFAAKQYQARLAGDPWAAGGQFAGRRAADLYTPEQIVASGGMTAENQLRSQQKKTDQFDPEELKRLNEQYRRTYV